jgi:hypothetical protein
MFGMTAFITEETVTLIDVKIQLPLLSWRFNINVQGQQWVDGARPTTGPGTAISSKTGRNRMITD